MNLQTGLNLGTALATILNQTMVAKNERFAVDAGLDAASWQRREPLHSAFPRNQSLGNRSRHGMVRWTSHDSRPAQDLIFGDVLDQHFRSHQFRLAFGNRSCLVRS